MDYEIYKFLTEIEPGLSYIHVTFRWGYSPVLKYGSLPLYPPTAQRGNAIAHSNSTDLLLSNNASDWLSGDFDNKNQ